jgi:hypothetical protein
MKWIMMFLMGLGGFICCLNFYLVFIRYTVYHTRGGKKEEYQWVSSLPAIGSLLVVIPLVSFWEQPWLRILGIGLLLIDTAGPLWFVVFRVYQKFSGDKE